jgi:hypothetical protein
MSSESSLRNTCPYCGIAFGRPLDPAVYSKDGTPKHFGETTLGGVEGDEELTFYIYSCPKCLKRTVDVHIAPFTARNTSSQDRPTPTIISIRPYGQERPVPDEVPGSIADDFREATRIATLSLKGAATLARRCVQATLRYCFPDMPRRELFDEIKWLIEQNKLPTDIGNSLHALRKAGNFGAHPSEDGLTPIYELSEEDLEACFLLITVLFEQLIVEPKRQEERLRQLSERMFPARKPKETH